MQGNRHFPGAEEGRTFFYYLKKYRLFFIIALAAGVLFLLISLGPEEEQETYHLITMDTMVELSFIVPEGGDAEEIKDAVFAEMERLEKLFSRTIADSDVSRVNNLAGIEPAVVSPESYKLIELAYHYALISNGAFEPTIGPLIDSWGFLNQEFRLPERAKIEQLLPLVNYQRLELDQAASTIYLPEKGMILELGGLAKGFILDRAMAVLKNYRVCSAFINAGGDIALLGSRPDGEPWKLGILHPRAEKKILAVLNVSDRAVVKSGDYERHFDRAGIAYHHIIDPQAGKPARELASVTVIAATAAEADALSTAIFVLGPSEGLALIEKMPGVEGVLVTPELKVFVSSGMEDIIEFQ